MPLIRLVPDRKAAKGNAARLLRWRLKVETLKKDPSASFPIEIYKKD